MLTCVRQFRLLICVCVRALIVFHTKTQSEKSPLGFFVHFISLVGVTSHTATHSSESEEKEEDLNMGWYNELTTVCDWTTPTAIFGNDW